MQASVPVMLQVHPMSLLSVLPQKSFLSKLNGVVSKVEKRKLLIFITVGYGLHISSHATHTETICGLLVHPVSDQGFWRIASLHWSECLLVTNELSSGRLSCFFSVVVTTAKIMV